MWHTLSSAATITWTLLAALLALPFVVALIAYTHVASRWSTPSRLPRLPVDADPTLLTDSATALARRLRAGEVTSEQLVLAHLARGRAVDGVLHCVAAWCDEGGVLQAARSADVALAAARTARSFVGVPPYLGVPTTVKEVFAVAGMSQTSAVIARLGSRPSATDASIIAVLKRSGFIVVSNSTTSELCMWYESFQIRGTPLAWTRTSTGNPYDPTRIVGGSSGGEAAMVASAASPVGVGSDIGGSIRMPAAFCGVFGHKPSGGLVSNAGQMPTSTCTVMATGPICRLSEDLWPLTCILARAGRGAAATGGGAADASLRAVALVDVRLPLGVVGKGTTVAALSRDETPISLMEVGLPGDVGARRRSRSRSRSSSPRARRVAISGGNTAIDDRGVGVAITLSPAPPILAWSAVTVFVLHPHDYGVNAPILSSSVQPCIRAAVDRAAHFLTARLGCALRVLPLPELRSAFDTWTAVLSLEEQPTFRELMEEAFGRRIDFGMELLKWCCGASQATLPATVLALIERIPLLVAPRRVARLKAGAEAFKARFNAILGGVNGVLLCPVHPTTAPLHNVPLLRPFNVAWTQIFNVSEGPATCVPMGLSGDGGLPVAIQVVGAHGFDCLTIAVARALEEGGLAGWVAPPSE